MRCYYALGLTDARELYVSRGFGTVEAAEMHKQNLKVGANYRKVALVRARGWYAAQQKASDAWLPDPFGAV